MIFHWIDDKGEESAGEIDEDVYYQKIFPIFRDNLKPLNGEK